MDQQIFRKAAAEARRRKLLAKGGDRLAQITGQLPEAADEEETPEVTPPAQHAVVTPPAAPLQPTAPLRPEITAPRLPASSAIAAELGAAVRGKTTLTGPPPQFKGTATNSKWAQYAAPGGGTRPRRALRRVTAGETLTAAVQGTSRLRLLLAALLALLLATRWDAVAVAKTTATSSSAPSEAELFAAARAAAASPPSSPLEELGASWQGLVRRVNAALSSLPWLPWSKQAASKPLTALPPPAKQPRLVARLEAKLRRHAGAMVVSPAGQLLLSKLAAASRSPLGRWAAAAVHALEAQAAAAARSPAGVKLAAAAQQAKAALAAAAASPHAQRVRAALERLPPLRFVPRLLQARLAAAAAQPVVQQALDAAERLPPMASLALLSLSLIGASAVALAAAPTLVHSTLDLDLQTPSMLARLAAALPGLQRQLSLLTAAQRLLGSLLDDAAAFVVTLVAYYQLPALLAGA
ncbi:hypothetical protein D9Q98_008294 [Chlorella vulgaris]|uniref:Uncharacterized protein n=1 Tax=Chlorella vulgaris TaxID=3077 RepID=A0A9D4TGG7_CHLVU|nr:hypothetical protein D9Q98_008294 [Chlorella vulgaris]